MHIIIMCIERNSRVVWIIESLFVSRPVDVTDTKKARADRAAGRSLFSAFFYVAASGVK